MLVKALVIGHTMRLGTTLFFSVHISLSVTGTHSDLYIQLYSWKQSVLVTKEENKKEMDLKKP